ncbi:unnamed protein product [Bemisia tabaci]|uniref:Uncharacterized protein n=1 Tax=Bemisia tabaci TaxID=7038 RepID=A0A9P0EZP6_BEMTA|nr:unnamed protein product [Bemisia tabaci]
MQKETKEELGELTEKIEGIKLTAPEGMVSQIQEIEKTAKDTMKNMAEAPGKLKGVSEAAESVRSAREKLEGFKEVVEIIRDTGDKLTRIEKKQMEMGEEISTLPREPSLKNSCSQMVKNKQEVGSKDVKFILEDADDPDGKEVKEKVKDAIKDQGWMVQGLARTKTGAILTVKGTEEEVNRKLKEIPVIKEGQLTMREVKDKKPMVRINGVDAELKEEELVAEIYKKNFKGFIGLP